MTDITPNYLWSLAIIAVFGIFVFLFAFSSMSKGKK